MDNLIIVKITDKLKGGILIMSYMTEMIKKFTDELNIISEKLENEKDEDEIMTLRFQAAVTIELIKNVFMGNAIAKYDSESNEAYIEFNDGIKEKVCLKK